MGEVLAALARALEIFTSHNGFAPAAGAEAQEKQGHLPSAQFRGYQSDIWGGGHREPFCMGWPGTVKSGTTSAALICLGDLMAPGADIVVAKLPNYVGEDSVNRLPTL